MNRGECKVCGAVFEYNPDLIDIHRAAEHNGARDLIEIEAMREIDAEFPTWPPVAPMFGIWTTRPRNARAVEANVRAGFGMRR